MVDDIFQAEASSVTEDQSTMDDIWSSLERLGYNKQLRLIHVSISVSYSHIF